MCINGCMHVDQRFVELLLYRFTEVDDSTNDLKDIYSGDIYKESSDFFSYPYNFSFTLNFDGAPKFKSSTMQIWPIQLCINELPPLSRYVSIHS